MINKVISDTIRMLRREKGWSQHKLAAISGVSRSRIALIEVRPIDCKFSTVYKLAKALDISLLDIEKLIEVEIK